MCLEIFQPAKYRSRLTPIHLVSLVPARLIGKYGYEKVLEPLIKDLKTLETQGLDIGFEGKKLHFHGTLSMVVCDNLAAHALGGYFCSFSTAQCFCRFCNCKKDQLQEPSHISHYTLCTKEGYDNIVQLVTEFPNLSSVYGIKSNSCLNQLQHFHVVNGLPPDLGHDLLEDFAKDVLNIVIVRCLQQNYFTIDDLNNVILSFSYSDIDKKNKPQVIKTTSVANLNIKQTACEMWNLMRLFPIMVGSFVPQSDSAWLIYLQFLQISERLCSPKFSRGDLVFLQSLIDEFFPQFLDEFGENYDLKPKDHFLQHYPKMIEIFGPLVKTLRFEAKHSYFKSCLAGNKNRKNIFQTMAKRRQIYMFLAYS